MKRVSLFLLALAGIAPLHARTVNRAVELAGQTVSVRLDIVEDAEAASFVLQIPSGALEVELEVGPQRTPIVRVPVAVQGGQFSVGRYYWRDARLRLRDREGSAILPLSSCFDEADLPMEMSSAPRPMPAPEPPAKAESYSRGKSRFIRVE